MVRELLVLGTASQAPTRRRNHNGYLLRWDGEAILFDPGDGVQRQMAFAGASATEITRICVTHFHGDHCLGLPGIIQRLSLDRVAHPVPVHFPAEGARFFGHLRHASSFHEVADLVESPVGADGVIATGTFGTLYARRLDHLVPAYGYRLVEPDGRRMLPDRLAAANITGPAIGELQRLGRLRVDGRVVTLEEMSVPRPGQRVAVIMDTRVCPGAYALAQDADLLVIESTFLTEDEDLAAEYGHLTATQAAMIAAESRVRRLVLTHFSQRYPDPTRYAAEAATRYSGEIIVAEDLMRVPVPRRAAARRSG